MITYYFSNKAKSLAEIKKPKAGCLVYVKDPTVDELELLERDYELDIDLLKDSLDPNEVPRLDEWADKVYIFTRFTLPESAKQTTSPLLIVYGKDMTFIVCRTDFTPIGKLLDRQDIVTSKRTLLLLQLLHTINADYKVRINSVAKRMWAIRSQLNKLEINNEDFVRFIDMEEDLNDFLAALEPMNAVLNHLLAGKYIRLYEDDRDLMEDLELGSHELITLADSQLKTIRNIRDAYSTIATNNLNKIF